MMNLNDLIAAAWEIDSLAEKRAERVRAWQDLANDAKNPDADPRDIARRKQELDAGVVVDLSGAIDRLRNALHGGL